MKSQPTAAMASAGKPMRVLCPTPDCKEVLCLLPPDTRLLTRAHAASATGRVTGTCKGCGHEFDLPVQEGADA